jgi:hypothetical protein
MKACGIQPLGIALGLALALALLLAGSTAQGQEEEYSLSWVTWTGGGTSSGGDYTLVATAAQPEVSLATSGGDYTLVGGVWGSPIAPRLIYLPLVLRNYP